MVSLLTDRVDLGVDTTQRQQSLSVFVRAGQQQARQDTSKLN